LNQGNATSKGSSLGDTSLESLEQLLNSKGSRPNSKIKQPGSSQSKEQTLEEVLAPLRGAEAKEGTPQSTTPRTLQQQLDQAYRDAKIPQQKSPAELRKQKRREYMAKVGKRNDSSFFASIGALVLIPPLAILGFAIATGYIDIFNP
jgi:hypothetical protein